MNYMDYIFVGQSRDYEDIYIYTYINIYYMYIISII